MTSRLEGGDAVMSGANLWRAVARHEDYGTGDPHWRGRWQAAERARAQARRWARSSYVEAVWIESFPDGLRRRAWSDEDVRLAP